MNTQIEPAEVKRTPSQKRKITQTVNAIIISDTLKDATKLLKCSQRTIYDRMRKFPEIRERINSEIAINPEIAKMKLQEKTLKAVSVVSELMETSHKDDIKLRASQDILNRAGITNKSNSGVQVNILNQIKADKKEYDL